VTNLSGVSDKSNVLGQVLAQRERVAARLAHVKHVVAVMSGKGGVGKSALTANLAAAFGMHGRSVGVLDADIHGASAAAMLGARGQQVVLGAAGARPCIGVADVRVMSMDLFLDDESTPVNWRHPGGLAADTFVWRSSLEANVLRELLADTDWGALDFLLIDMPPGADRFETLARFVPDLSGTLVVTIPSQASHLVVRRAIAAVRQANMPILGLVENMAGLVDESGQVAHELFPDGNGAAFAAKVNVPYLGTVPFDPRLARTTDGGRPFVLEHTHTPAGQAILALMQKMEEMIVTMGTEGTKGTEGTETVP
jgi:ATP-binding protein involved in chromosome partitioning